MTKFCKKCQLDTELYPSGGCKTCVRRYQQSKKDKIAEYQSAYYSKNKEKIASHYAENKVKILERAAARYVENRDELLSRVTAYNKANPEKNRIRCAARRARKLSSGGVLSPDLAEKLLILQNGKCACCGTMLNGKYHLDHIIPLSRGGDHDDSNIQLLTPYCNQRKGAKDPIEFMQKKGFLL